MAGDEDLEIAFWWFGGDAHHPIEDSLEAHLDGRRSRRRRLPWPGRRQSDLRPELDYPDDQGRPVA